MRTLVALAAAMMLAASCSAISRPSGLVAQSWSATYYSRWYTLDTGVSDLLIEGTSYNVIARQMSTGTIRKTWTAMDGDDYRMVDGTGTSSLNRLKLYSFNTIASRTVLNVKTLGSSMLTPTFSNSNYTLPTYRSAWYPMTSVAGVIYLYSDRYLIGIQASNGQLVTNMTLGTSSSAYVSSNALAVGYAYADGAKFLTFKLYQSGYRQVTVDIRRNYVTMDCATSSIYSSSSSYVDAYPAFAPSYSTGSSTMYPMIFAYGSTSSYNYGAMVNATPASCNYVWRRSTSSTNIPSIRMEGSRTTTRPGLPFTFVDTTNAIYASYVSFGADGRLVWLNYRTGATTRNILVDSSISSFTNDQCSSNLMAGPTLIGSDLILSFDIQLYQYSSATTTISSTWSFNYGSVFSSLLDVDDAGCAAWRYKVIGSKTLFITNSGGAKMAAMAIGTGGSSGEPSGTYSPGSSSSYYSPWYQVTMSNSLTGSAAKSAIQSTLYSKYGLLSSSLSGWSYSGSYVTFRIYYGSVKSTAESNAASGLYQATTNSTLRRELGFASCSQTIDPNFGAAVAAAFGTLFIVLILIGVALLVCVIAIIVCCCCCTAKAVADASAPPQQTVVMANQAAYVPMNQPVGYAQPGYAQPGQVQGGNML